MCPIRRVYVEKKDAYNVESRELFNDLKESLGLDNLAGVRVVNRYDISGISEEGYKQACYTIFSEPPVDNLYEEELELADGEYAFGVEYLPGQYDQRADSAEQCMQILNSDESPVVKTAKIVILRGGLKDKDIERVKSYYINPVDSREAELARPETLDCVYAVPGDVAVMDGFTESDAAGLEAVRQELGLAMSMDDILHTQSYFRDTEKRNPTITEIRVLDTYWSDHCRHTTFLTGIEDVDIEEGKFTGPVKQTYEKYLEARKELGSNKDICLMDIALAGMKKLRKDGKLEDLEISGEVNAASIVVPVDVDGEEEEWLVMFKNETHNHPTEIEPFGGAATCLGGAIRDPLSGRSYVYQAMRITGSGDPRTPVEETLSGKLPQKKIAVEAARGYSSYGNQIGLATGQVVEIYDEKYVAKHMEIGAVIAAAPRENVFRGTAEPGDVVVLLGGRTGRDGCGGATGSSKEHTKESIEECGAEVQKGNPTTERKIQRLFRNPAASKMIKVCNDFGAGGISVAIGELAPALEIELDAVTKKYAGLDGTELAISESQERMAVVVDKDDVERFIALADTENLEATVVAGVKANRRLVMRWNGKVIVDLCRDFLDTNGALQRTNIQVRKPPEEENYFQTVAAQRLASFPGLKEKWLANLADINICSQKGLVEHFDSSIGAGSVLMPFGGKYQLTPAQSMVAKIPVLKGEDTNTGTVMSYGFNPGLSTWSPFHGALYAVIESVAKVVASGGRYQRIRFTFQEYFEKLGTDYSRWGKPFSALLGAYFAQIGFGLPAIGGKDSVSGTFHDMDVPPTLVSFAVAPVDVRKVISPEFKKPGSRLVVMPVGRDENEMPDFEDLKRIYGKITELMEGGRVLAAQAVTMGGIAEAVSKMSFGNKIGVNFDETLDESLLFSPGCGSIVLEIKDGEDTAELLGKVDFRLLGRTVEEESITVNGVTVPIEEALKAWEEPLEGVYKTKTDEDGIFPFRPYYAKEIAVCKTKIAAPRVFIPVFPGTNCEYDTARQFEKAGAVVETLVFKNLLPHQIGESVAAIVRAVNSSQIVMIPGGFSAGDEPEGSGKFIATVFRNPEIKEAVMNLLYRRDGLMLGICNGFQALIKLGLVPYGDIRELSDDAPTLTYNTIGRHVSCMVNTRIVSNKSPWLANFSVGDIHTIPVSHGEGRFVGGKSVVQKLFKNGQLATQYVDFKGNPTMDIKFNPNGSVYAIEGITSPDGRVLGKMGHSERTGTNVAKNIPGSKNQEIFSAGVQYFR